MCGRIRQAGDGERYMETLSWNPRQLLADPKQPRYNVPPGTRPLVLHRIGDGGEHADHLFWGYKPPWYKRGPASNARLDTVLKRSPFWRPLHDRRPICLTPDDALAWVDPGTHVDDALAILSTPRPESAFEWWAVTRAMGDSRYQFPDASEPVTLG